MYRAQIFFLYCFFSYVSLHCLFFFVSFTFMPSTYIYVGTKWKIVTYPSRDGNNAQNKVFTYWLKRYLVLEYGQIHRDHPIIIVIMIGGGSSSFTSLWVLAMQKL